MDKDTYLGITHSVRMAEKLKAGFDPIARRIAEEVEQNRIALESVESDYAARIAIIKENDHYTEEQKVAEISRIGVLKEKELKELDVDEDAIRAEIQPEIDAAKAYEIPSDLLEEFNEAQKDEERSIALSLAEGPFDDPDILELSTQMRLFAIEQTLLGAGMALDPTLPTIAKHRLSGIRENLSDKIIEMPEAQPLLQLFDAMIAVSQSE